MEFLVTLTTDVGVSVPLVGCRRGVTEGGLSSDSIIDRRGERVTLPGTLTGVKYVCLKIYSGTKIGSP